MLSISKVETLVLKMEDNDFAIRGISTGKLPDTILEKFAIYLNVFCLYFVA